MNSESLTLPVPSAPSPAEAPVEPSRHLAGDLAIWVFICAELLAFAVFFVAYGVARARHVDLFNAGQLTLDRNAGAINTVLLITGSWFVVQAVARLRAGNARASATRLLFALACGGGFLVVKVFEYKAKFAAGISLSTDTFYMFYISLTFFHLMHVLLGMVILVLLWNSLRRGPGPTTLSSLESGAAYWHMVDLVWIILFPLVYVLR